MSDGTKPDIRSIPFGRRGFLKAGAVSAMGVLLPGACYPLKEEGTMSVEEKKTAGHAKSKFQMVDLSEHLNWPRNVPSGEWWQNLVKTIGSYPKGTQSSWGIPFALPEGEGLRVILVGKGMPEVTIPLKGRASYACTLHTWHQKPFSISNNPPQEGLVVGEFVLRYADGNEHTQWIRLRFETGSTAFLTGSWLVHSFHMHETNDPTKPTAEMTWGNAQYGLGQARMRPAPSLYAFENPHPDKELASFTIRGFHESPLSLSGLTLFNGKSHPLRHLPRRSYRVGRVGGPVRIESAQLDLGLIARIEETKGPRDEQWLASPYIGLSTGGAAEEPAKNPEDLLEIVGAEDATVTVRLQGESDALQFSLGEAYHDGASISGEAKLEVLDKQRQWMLVRVIDSSTGKPTPTRIHFSGERGQYLAPYGHHAQVNTNWFEDYGADLVVGGRSFAYCPGEFNTELPAGDIYVEICKGFEYRPIRRKVTIAPGQQVLELTIERWKDLRSAGWVTADTHVHFLSPQTAWLEAQCEGVNVVNLLASQWGRLFTNVGDISGRVGVAENDTIVYVGTENRNHMLGHMSMLGTQGLPVYPMCCGGPSESWVGDPDYMTLTEWAEQNRRKGGLVIRPHFPFCGNTEDPIPILRELVDALEVNISGGGSSFPVQEWYRYLNNGYRLAVVGGTDKMSAGCALGWMRTYAKIDPNEPFTYANWANAVRAGKTFSSIGPLMDMSVEGREIGDTITLPASGGTLEVRAVAESFIPLGNLEILCNGRVVAAEKGSGNGQKVEVSARVAVERSGWIAARCTARMDHPGAYAAGHTSPVYVRCGDSRAFDGPAMQHMLALVEGGRESLEKIATFGNTAARERMLRIFEEARVQLLKRLREEGGIEPHHGSGPFHFHAPDASPHRH